MRLMASVFLAALLVAARGVSAQPAAVDALVTLDPNSQLEWLDLSETAGLSFDDVSGLLDTDPRFGGWRYASLDEVESLWRSAGVTDTFGGFASANFGGASLLATLMGATATNSYFTSLTGVVGPANPTSGAVMAPALIISPSDQQAAANLSSGSHRSLRIPTFASWLVRPAALQTTAAGPVELLAALIQDVAALVDLPRGFRNSLGVKLNAAMAKLTDGNNANDDAVRGTLSAFVHELDAQRGKRLTSAEADGLIDSARDVLAALDS